MASQKSIEAMLARRASHRSMLERPPYLAVCPRCHVGPGEPCRRPDGELRPAHLERFMVEDSQETLFTSTEGGSHG